MFQQSCLPTDMVLLLSGGAYDGQLIPVKTQKCFLGADESTDGKPKCAIFRGPQGATLRSFADDVLVNGEPKTVHWLAEGDRIEFSNSTSAEIRQLGCLSAETESAEAEPTSTSETKPLKAAECETGKTDATQETELADDSENSLTDQRIAEMEKQISELQSSADQVGDVDKNLNQVSEQISGLVSMATNGNTVDAADEKEKPTREAAGTVLDFPAGEEDAPVPEVPAPTETPSPRSSASSASSSMTSDSMANEWANIESSLFSTPAAEPVPVTETEASETLDQFDATQGEESQPEPEEVIVADNQDTSMLQDSLESVFANTPEPSSDQSTEFDPVTENKEISNTEVEEMAPEQKNESVSDLLARMQADGQWDGVPDENNVTPEPIAAPEPVQIQEPIPSIALADGNADVDDYMSQLLSRMRGGEEPVAAPIKEKKTSTPEAPKAQATSELPPSEILTQEEYVPQQKAKKIESLSAMRELANSTARTAVQSSEASERKELAYVQLAIGVASIIMSGYYFGVVCQSFGDTGFIIGVLCIAVSGFLGYRFVNTMQKIKGVVSGEPKEKSKKTEQPAA